MMVKYSATPVYSFVTENVKNCRLEPGEVIRSKYYTCTLCTPESIDNKLALC
jgi:hypothetical protein